MKFKILKEWKVTHRKLEIEFSQTIDAANLKKLLLEVPDSAILDDWFIGKDTITATFHHEVSLANTQ